MVQRGGPPSLYPFPPWSLVGALPSEFWADLKVWGSHPARPVAQTRWQLLYFFAGAPAPSILPSTLDPHCPKLPTWTRHPARRAALSALSDTASTALPTTCPRTTCCLEL